VDHLVDSLSDNNKNKMESKMAEEIKSESEQKKEDWMNSKWRPMMGWMYMVVCTMDMVVFPILWSLLQTLTHSPITQWNPLTLQGAGLFHIAMGAVLGIAAFGRTQEKLNGANNGGISLPSSNPTAPSAPAPNPIATPTPIAAPTARPVPKPPVPELEPDDPPTRNTRND
jgi:hypothetical protein